MKNANKGSGSSGPSGNEAGFTASPGQDNKIKYSRNGRTISGRLHDELVMMDIEQGKYFSLNPVATRIWELLEKLLTEDELCVILIDEYDVESERCRLEVSEHLMEMVRMGLVLGSEK